MSIVMFGKFIMAEIFNHDIIHIKQILEYNEFDPILKITCIILVDNTAYCSFNRCVCYCNEVKYQDGDRS